MVQITMSERFAQKFADSIGALNEELYSQKKRIEIVDEGKEVPSPKARAAKNNAFTAALAQLVSNHFNGFLIDVTDTNSMDPWIDSGHKAVMVPFQSFAPLRKEDLQVGDIILFDRALDGAKNVLHRIISIQDDGKMIVTRGDNTAVHDGQIVMDDIHYVCIGVVY